MTMVMTTNDSEDHEGQGEFRNNRTFLSFVVYKYYTRVSFFLFLVRRSSFLHYSHILLLWHIHILF